MSRRIILSLVLLLMVFSCRPHSQLAESEKLHAIYKLYLSESGLTSDQVWKKLIVILDRLDWQIQTLDKESGVIVLQNQRVSPGLCTCGYYAMTTTSSGRRRQWREPGGIHSGYLNIYLEAADPNNIVIIISGDFYIEQQQLNFFTGQIYYDPPRKCASSGLIESFIFEQLKSELPETQIDLQRIHKKL